MTNTKTYENMTVTVTCKEKEDTEMMELLQRYQDAKTAYETAKEYYIPRTEAIGRAKWTVVVNQILSLVKVAEEVNLFPRLNLTAVYHTADTEARVVICVSKQRSHYCITWRCGTYVYDSVVLDASPECCSEYLLDDKDSWLAKWDEYEIYSKMRNNLIHDIKAVTKIVIAKKDEIVETYKEFAGE